MLWAFLGIILMFPADLPVGSAPRPVALPHFPDRLHAFVWRNWALVPMRQIAKTVGAKPEEIVRLGKAMGLPNPPRISALQQRRSTLTVIRRNWHLLPYEQLLILLDWTPEQLAYTLKEDDFLYIKLGSLKPNCPPIRYHLPDAATVRREEAIATIARSAFPEGLPPASSPLFDFVGQLQKKKPIIRRTDDNGQFSPRFCYSYFALYGDPLLDKQADPYPDGYLAQLAASGVDGIWLQAVLYKLAPFPWDSRLSDRYEERLQSLRLLVARAKRHGIGVYLYLNEPRTMPLSFYAEHPDWKGVVEGDQAALCTSRPEVQNYLRTSIASICRAVPELAGFFTITASENLTNCWSHGSGANCPRCSKRTPAEEIAEANTLIRDGIRQAGSSTRLIAWDWGWSDKDAKEIIERLPADVTLMSVSEWDLPIKRGGVASSIGEYSVSAIGPGPRAMRHWELARKRGLKVIAKIQAANSWELSAVPYLPVLENVARHAANLRDAHLDGLMLGWTLGGYPSPNLEVVAEVGQGATPDTAMQTVAERRFGREAAPAVVRAWQSYSTAFQEFPFHIGLAYTAPMQYGPANLLWEEPTGYQATMIGFPYDDLDTWRAVYPPSVFISQFEKVADGFEAALRTLKKTLPASVSPKLNRELLAEQRIAEAAAIHFRSVAHQARFIVARRALESAKTTEESRPLVAELERILEAEISLARRLYRLQSEDSRLGFEASNQYYYVPLDLLEKIVNCADLRDRWLPLQRKRLGL